MIAEPADQDNAGLVALALIAGVLHATAAVLAARELIVARRAVPAPT